MDLQCRWKVVEKIIKSLKEISINIFFMEHKNKKIVSSDEIDSSTVSTYNHDVWKESWDKFRDINVLRWAEIFNHMKELWFLF